MRIRVKKLDFFLGGGGGCPENGENGEKIGFFELLEKFGH